MATRTQFIVTGIPQVRKNLALIEIGFKNEIEKAVLKATLLVEKTAKERVPVKTGRLRRSIRGGLSAVGRGFVEGTVGANTVYAAAVEFGRPLPGGGFSKKQPYLSRAVTENRSNIQKIISDGLKRQFRGFTV